MLITLKKLRAILTPGEQRQAVWMLFIALLMAMAEMVSVISIMPFLSVLTRPGIVEQNPWLHRLYSYTGFPEPHTFIFALGAASIALVAGSSLFKTVTQHLLNRFVQLLRHSISHRLLATYLRQPYEFFLDRHSADLSKAILTDVDLLLGSLIQPLSQLIVQGIIVITILILIFSYDAPTALITTLVVGSLYGSLYALIRRRLRRMGEELQDVNEQRYRACSESLHGVRDIKINHAESAYLDRYYQASRTQARHLAATDTLSQVPLYFVESIAYSGLILIALMLLNKTGDVAHIMPALGLYAFAAYRMLPAAQLMYRGFARLEFSLASLNAIYDDLTLSGSMTTQTDATAMPVSAKSEIRLRGIKYSYPSNPYKFVLDEFNLVIPVNTSIGIAGASGSGKSTIMDILLGLLRPQAGSLIVDGAVITDDDISTWQRSIGYVPQHIYLVDASIAENIAFGVPRCDIDMASVKRAACAAQIHDFVIAELPNGYATTVGDRGIRLSGGQRQRIAIARALYRDPPILFMDEATSALDHQTEAAVNEAIRFLSGRKTIVVIAHRESSLKYCDHIISVGK